VYWSPGGLATLVLTGVVTVTSTVPALPAGAVTVMEVDELTTRPVPATVPNFTAEAPVNPVPVRVTKVPPPGTPAVGLTAVTVGHTLNTNWSAELVALVPAGVVTVMSTVPWASAGEMAAVIDVPEETVKLVAAPAPKLTAVAALKFAPVMLTEVPPVVYPLVGVTAVTTGALS